MGSNAVKPLPFNPFDDEAPTTQRARVLDMTDEIDIDLEEEEPTEVSSSPFVDDLMPTVPPQR